MKNRSPKMAQQFSIGLNKMLGHSNIDMTECYTKITPLKLFK